MEAKIAQFINKGMRQDLSIDKVSNEYAFENVNIRITELENNTLLSVTNELGNQLLDVTNEDTVDNGGTYPTDTLNHLGALIGSCALEDYLILFTQDKYTLPSDPFNIIVIERIIRLRYQNNKLLFKILYKGSNKTSVASRGLLKFPASRKIETLADYESESNIKVYWIDGVNQPRFINIVATDEKIASWNEYSFDFLPVISSFASLAISRSDNTEGKFPSGVIQYALSYSNIHGQESSVFCTSPIKYIMFSDRAGGPEEIINCSFNLTLSNLDTNFDRVNIYSIYRASLNGTPISKRIASLDISSAQGGSLTYIDNNDTGEIIDNSELFYKGGDLVIPGTADQKDSVLFFGDLKIDRPKVNSEIEDLLKTSQIVTSPYTSLPVSYDGYFPYAQQGYNYRYLKAEEIYRIGLQLQDKYGKWSAPIFVSDYSHHIRPTEGSTIQIPTTTITIPAISDTSYYKRIRPVIVFPDDFYRSCVAQGVLNPTVFKLKDRYKNAPFAEASWFFRPIPSDTNKTNNTYIEYRNNKLLKNNSTKFGEIQSQDNLGCVAQPTGHFHDSDYEYNFARSYAIIGNDYAHLSSFLPISDRKISNSGFTGLGYTVESENDQETISQSGMDIIVYGVDNNSHYAVDTNIVTLNSPDLENVTEDYLSIKLRIVGTIPIDKAYGLYNVSTDTPAEQNEPSGFWDLRDTESTHHSTYSQWIDVALYGLSFSSFGNMLRIGNPLYPWQCEGPLCGNNTSYSAKGGLLRKKILSNTLYSNKSSYFSYQNVLEYSEVNKAYVYDPDKNPLLLLKDIDTHDTVDEDLISDYFSYYGEVNTIVSPINESFLTFLYGSLSDNGNFRAADTYSNLTGSSFDDVFVPTNKIAIDKTASTPTYLYDSQYGAPHPIWPASMKIDTKYPTEANPVYETAPVNIKYKSSKHAVLSLGYMSYVSQPDTRGYGGQIVLPNTGDIDARYFDGAFYGYISTALGYPYWMIQTIYDASSHAPRLTEYMYDPYPDNSSHNKDYLYIGELYREVDPSTVYGGTSEFAISQNQWIPIGSPVSIPDNQQFFLQLNGGDTSYQRWDCLKTCALTNEDTNVVTETLSFMVEAHTNLDGRYDRNRGRTDNTTSSLKTINLFNDVYNQEDNFFSYRVLDDFYYENTVFPNQFTWSLPKSPNVEVDAWTNITLSSIYGVDGTLGKINKIKRYNDTLLGFQDSAIFEILFNSRSQVATTTGIPIELANSGKVDGVRYLTNKEGCKNKWTICETPNGLYFIDDLNFNIVRLANNSLEHLSTERGFDRHMRSNPGYISTYYDNILKDVYFTSNEKCLVFSEKLNEFMSFMTYSNTALMCNFNKKFISVQNATGTQRWTLKLYENHCKDCYNYFYDGAFKDYSITYRVNPEPLADKIFSTIEFDSEMWNTSDSVNGEYEEPITFSSLIVNTDYQKGTMDLTKFPNLIRKFRKWRANIPRDTSHPMDRMRGNWITIKLLKENEDYSNDSHRRLEFHSLGVKYFV